MTRYLSVKELAERIGVKPASVGRYKLPEPDAFIGDVRGWLPATVDTWNAERPGRGGRIRQTRPDPALPPAPVP